MTNETAPAPYYDAHGVTLYQGDNREVLPLLGTVDAVVTDPPYGLAFMGKRWDYDVPSVETWQEVLARMKPGAHLLAFAGTRTQHRMAQRIEDAGFEIRDVLAWVFGSGFPKSLDVSKAIDASAGAERETVGTITKTQSYGRDGNTTYGAGPDYAGAMKITAPATAEAARWEGWGTALKPALEPITLARKPLAGTVAANVTTYGTGGINVDACRVDGPAWYWGNYVSGGQFGSGKPVTNPASHPLGRWPANVIHDGSEEAAAALGGEASRFFYSAKASRDEREHGLRELEIVSGAELTGRAEGSAGLQSPRAGAGHGAGLRNTHPTVKPIDLMRYLCRLVTPPGGVVLDPFAGSGSTLLAARAEGFRAIGIELDPDYCEIATHRLKAQTFQERLL